MKKKILLTIMLFILSILSYATVSNATFYISDYTIDAELTEGGDLLVIETLQYYTDETANGVTRKIVTKNPDNLTNSADALNLKYVMVDGEICTKVNTAVKGDDGVFTYTNSGDEYNITLYTPFTSSTKTVKYGYELTNVAVKYNDIAELYWNFVGDEWEDQIKNLTINIILPEKAARDTIYVYGHGSDNGTFTKKENYITLKASDISINQAVDARILFSTNAISASTKNIDQDVLSKYIYEEEGWSVKKDYIIGNLTANNIAAILIIAIIIVWIIIYIVYDKEYHVPRVKYYRELPFNLEPEMLQLIYYEKMRNNSFYIGFLNLIKLGVYKLEDTVNEVGRKSQKLIYNPNHEQKLKGHQKAMISIINGFMTTKGIEISIDITELASKMKRSSGRGFTKYKDKLESEKEKLFGEALQAPKKILTLSVIIMVIVIIILSLIAGLSGGSFSMASFGCVFVFAAFLAAVYVPIATSIKNIATAIFIIAHAGCFQIVFIIMLSSFNVGFTLWLTYILAAALIIYVNRIRKYTKEEREIVAKINGLKRYIKECSMLKDKDSIEYINLWEDYFIMAVALNINKKTINYFYNYGQNQINSSLGYAMHGCDDYMSFQTNVYTSFYNYQHRGTPSGFSSGGSSSSGSSGGFSGGSSSGGGGGRWPEVADTSRKYMGE